MQVVLWLFAASYLPVVAAWWYFAIFYRRQLERAPLQLEPVGAWPPPLPAPSLTVFIACHNEADSITACVRGLLRQTYPRFRVLIANDRSTDGTGEVVRGLAAEDARVHLVEIHELPPGWMGKTHALAKAVRGCDADYLLFIDSDVALAPGALNAVMQKSTTERIDFLSLWPYLDLRSFSEKLLTFPAVVLLSLWALPRRPVAGCLADETQLGNGQFLLVRRVAYEQIGGHAAVAGELAEDAVLAGRARAAGQHCWAGLGAGMYCAYREGGFRRTANSLARILVGSLQTQRRLWAGMQVLLGGGFSAAWIPPAALICIGLGRHVGVAVLCLVLSVLHWIGMMMTLSMASRKSLARRGPLVWFPFGSAIVAGILVWCSFLCSGWGTVRWGATRYRVRGSRIVEAGR